MDFACISQTVSPGIHNVDPAGLSRSLAAATKLAYEGDVRVTRPTGTTAGQMFAEFNEPSADQQYSGGRLLHSVLPHLHGLVLERSI